MKLRPLRVLVLLALAGCGAQSAAVQPAASTMPLATAAPTALPPTAAPTATPTAADVLAHTRIAYVQTADRAGGEYDLYLMKPDGSDPRQLTNLPGIETTPAWSSDGQRLAFVATRDSDNPSDCASGYVEFRCNFEIYTIRADGAGLQRVTDSPNYDRDPAWSPDGAQIVYSSRETGAPYGHLFAVDPDGTHRRQLTRGSFSDQAPSWSPDGTQIAFMRSTEQEIQIYVMAADVSQVTQVTQRGKINAQPAWSPDEALIAYVAVSGDGAAATGTLAVMRPDGSDVQTIPTEMPVSSGYAPSWSPDGQALLFVGQERGYYNIYRVGRDGRNFTRVTDYTQFFSAPTWSPLLK
jgi:Tol biopolymer transport system component